MTRKLAAWVLAPMLAVFALAGCADDPGRITGPDPLLKYGPPTGGGGGGGGGGGEDPTAGNNLSYPVVWADAAYQKTLPGTPGMTPITNGSWWWWWGVIEGAEGTADVPLSCPPDPANEALCLDGTAPGAGAVKAYLQKDEDNTWQAQAMTAAGNVDVDWIDWGDDLESKDWTLSSQVRIEHVVTEAVATPMTEYVMRHTSGWGADEAHGLSVLPATSVAEVLANTLPTVFSACARLSIQKLNVPRGDPAVSTLVWQDTMWVGTAVNQPIFSKAVWQAADGPGYYNAEINVKGKIIYGYTWGVRRLNQGAGDYRITFSFDPDLACPALHNTFITTATQIVLPEEEVVVTAEPVDAGGVGVLRPDLNLTYMDVRIVAKQGGGGKPVR